jgi:hypothetical protein
MPPGSPNLFKPDIGRNLSKVFQPQFGGFESPQILGGVVSLTHDFPGTGPYQSPSLYDNQGAADVTLISTAITPPDGYIWLVDECHVLAANEPAARTLRLYLTYQTTLGPFSVTIFRVDTGPVFNTPYVVGRRFVVPPQGVLSLTASALTAGGNIRFTMSYLQLPAGQFVPKN